MKGTRYTEEQIVRGLATSASGRADRRPERHAGRSHRDTGPAYISTSHSHRYPDRYGLSVSAT